MNRQELEKQYGKVYDTKQAIETFEIQSFLAPYCVAIERKTGKKGVLLFQDYPRFYFDFSYTD